MQASCPICGTELEREDAACTACRGFPATAVPIREWVGRRAAAGGGAGGETGSFSPWLERKVVGLMIQAAVMVQEELDDGRLHGSLKPDSLFVDAREQPHILDFGRVLPPGDVEALCVWRGEARWVCYEAAEVLRGEPGSARSDVYGLGCVLYELLGGAPPYQGCTSAEALDQARVGTPTPLRTSNPGIDAELEQIVMRAMDPDPQNRFSSAGDLAESLETWLITRSLRLSATGSATVRSGPSPVLVTGLVVILSMVLASLVLWWNLARHGPRTSPPSAPTSLGPTPPGKSLPEEEGGGGGDSPASSTLSESGSEEASMDPEGMAEFALRVASRPSMTSEEVAQAGRMASKAYRQAPESTSAQLAALVWSMRPVPSGGTPVISPRLRADLRAGAEWEAEAHGWMRSNRWPEAVLAYTRALITPGLQGPWSSREAQTRLFRAQAYRRLALWREAGVDNCWARGIPARGADTPSQLVDLSAWYNARLEPNWHGDRPGNDLAALPRGVVQLAAVPFDVRGLIQLQALSGPPMKWPVTVSNVAVGAPCRRLHLLHAATHCKTDAPGTEVGRVVWIFASGVRTETPVVLGVHVRDWWRVGESPPLGADAAVAWVGFNEVSRSLGERIGLYRTTWMSPFPGEELRALEFDSGRKGPGWFIVAATVD